MMLHEYFLKSTGVSTDTRNISKGTIFFALKGDNFNGNVYAEKALELGASFAVIDDSSYKKDDRYILVNDTLSSLQELAKFHRQYLNIPILSLTGSNGKTTTKELINTVLESKYNVVATKGNLNNHIGVPLTLLSMNKNTEFGIVEMGANHIGEINMLCDIAQPDYGYITNFGKAHLEGFGNEEGVIKGKSELYDYLRTNSKLTFLNGDDPKQLKQSQGLATYSFGKAATNDVLIEFVEAHPFVKMNYKTFVVKSQLIGAYNATNISAAICIGQYFKVPEEQIKTSIEAYVPSNNRSQIIIQDKRTIILDAYNANPSSMLVALENLNQLEATSKYAILGDMFELGDASVAEHQNIVDVISEFNFDNVFLVGEHFNTIEVTNDAILTFKSTTSLIDSNKFKELSEGVILIKGSRGMALERLLENS